jgi:STE24 endopeptidase
VWKTDGAVVNAAVAGIVPWLRYVMLSDGLVQHLTEEEIEAVFGHEVGHIRHHHLWFYVAFLLGSSLFLLVALTTTSRVLADLLGEPTMHDAMSLAHGLAAPLAGMALYFGVFFGFLSRRFERQADVFGCRAVSCGRLDCSGDHALDAGASGAGHDGVGPGLLTAPSPQPPPPEARGGSSTPQASREGAASGALALCPVGIRTFVSALEKVSALNGSTRDTRSWRHFSIAKRVEFLERLTVQPDLEPRFQRVVLALKMLVLAALLASGWWAWGHGQELAREFIGAS